MDSNNNRLISIDPSFTGTGVATYVDGEYDIFLIKTKRKKVKCPVCGRKLGDPNSKSHIKSKRHQNALKNKDKMTVIVRYYPSPTIDYTKRILGICKQIEGTCKEKKITHAIIEGMAFGARGRSVFDSGGLSHMIRATFLRLGIKLMVIPPSVAKLFWTDKGNASKDDMIGETKDRGVEIPFDYDDNCNDAFVFLIFLKQFLNGNLDEGWAKKIETSWKRSKTHPEN